MLVTVDGREYDLYLGFNPSGEPVWTMQTYDAFRDGAWLWTNYDVSNVNPFASCVTYYA